MRRLVLLLAAMFAVAAYAAPAAVADGSHGSHHPCKCKPGEHPGEQPGECVPDTPPETPPETTPVTPPVTPPVVPETPPVTTPETPVTPTTDTPEYTVPDTTTPVSPKEEERGHGGETEAETEDTVPVADTTPASQPQSPTATTEANALPRTGTDGQLYTVLFLGIAGAVAALGGFTLRRVLSH